MHSAVWACIPLVMSIIRNMRSIICAPPMIVRIKDAWPGQSTRVNWRYYSLISLSNLVGTRVKNAEKPRSKVMPRYWDCGFLSRLAVDVTALRILQMEVLPESTCPSTPILIFKHLLGWIVDTSSFVISSSYFSILLIWLMKMLQNYLNRVTVRFVQNTEEFLGLYLFHECIFQKSANMFQIAFQQSSSAGQAAL